MKTLITLVLSVITLATVAHGASETHPYDAYFQGDVYLSDDTNNALKTRIPAGSSMAVNGNNVTPNTNIYIWGGSQRIETNKYISMTSFDAVGGIDTGVVIDADSGEITLRSFVTGTGWVETTLTPTNPPITSMDIPDTTNVPSMWIGEAGTATSGLYLQSRTAAAGIYNTIHAEGSNADASKVVIGASPYGVGDVWSFYKTYMDCGGKSISNATFTGTHVGNGAGLTNLPSQTLGGSLAENLNGSGFSITNTPVVSSFGDLTITAAQTDGTGTNDHITLSYTAGNLYLTPEDVDVHLLIISLPTTDPNVAGAMWKSGTNVYISTGP